MELIFIFLVPWLCFCLLVGIVGKQRKIGFAAAFWFSFFLSPIVGIVIVLLSPIAIAERPMELHPEALAFFNLGREKARTKNNQGAIEDYEKALMRQPHFPVVHFNLACSYSIMHDKVQSFKHLSKAVEQGYNNLDKINADPDLEFLRSQAEFKEFAVDGYKSFEIKTAPNASPFEKIEKLGKLRDQGLITDEEFQAKKGKLLESI